MAGQNDHIVFQVLTDLKNTGVFQQRFEQLNRAFELDLLWRVLAVAWAVGGIVAKIKAALCFATDMTKRDVAAIAGLGRK